MENYFNSKFTDYKIYQTNESVAFGESQKMIKTNEGDIWVVNTTFKTGIGIFDGRNWRTVKLSNIFGGDEHATDIIQSNDGTIWIGGLGNLYAFKDKEWKLYTSPQFNIPANKLQLYKSKTDKLWIAGLKSKVYLVDYSNTRWVSYKGLNFQCELPEVGEQWFLDVGGRAISKNGTRWLAWSTVDGLIDAPVNIFASSKGQIWAAGSHEGVAATALLKNGKWHKQLHPKLSWGIDYRAVFEAADGSLWFGASVDAEVEKGQLSGVLQLINPIAEVLDWKHYKYNENGLFQSNAYGIGQTSDGKIWMGGSSLVYYENGLWNRLPNEQLRQFVNTVESNSTHLFVGSRYYGLHIYDGKTWRNYNTETGLSGNTIISIDAINENKIWVATENNICLFDGTRWYNNIFPSALNMDFEGGNITHSHDESIWINHSERAWKRRAFSHHKSVSDFRENFNTYCYTPDKIAPDTEITFYTEEVSSDGNTIVKWSGKDFFGETDEAKLSYSYRLNNEEWSDFTTQNDFTFLSLANGDYHLEVRAMDTDFNIDPTPAIIQFSVKPPVWKQAWFIALVSTLLTIILIFAYNIFSKKKKLEKLNSSLQKVNKKLKSKSKKIKFQNKEILKQQQTILAQKDTLEQRNQFLRKQKNEIQQHRDQLEGMIVKVEELSKTKLKFFTNISHELRTPLSLILGPIDQLQDAEFELTEVERQRLYSIVDRNASRLSKLINQLLEFRAIENASLELKLANGSIIALLAETIGMFQNFAKKRDIKLSFKPSLEQEFMSSFDADKIEKIVTNLLSNSFKNTPDGGNISLNLSKVEGIDYQLGSDTQQYFYIKVKDSGKGIAAKDLPHIFERYYHSDDLTQHQKNSGIGLSYIKELVEKQKGKIRLRSKEGEGTEVDIFIPVLSFDESQNLEKPLKLPVKEQVEEKQQYQIAKEEVKNLIKEINEEFEAFQITEGALATTNRPRILIVEDNPDLVLFLKGLLQKDYQVITAEHGKAGLKIAHNHTLDLILCDIMMPIMDGISFCKAVKKSLATSHIPVVMLTAKALEVYEVEGYEIGADDYITKPFNSKILMLKIKNILRRRTALQEKISRDFRLLPKQVKLTSPDEKLLEQLIQMMEENMDNAQFNVNKMCQAVNLSHMHFIRKVKLLTGKKPVDLLKSFRMKRAKDLLKQKKLNIAEVAYSVGFEMPSSFSRAFKKEFGESPSSFLEKVGKDQL